jgi:hypothetical protein
MDEMDIKIIIPDCEIIPSFIKYGQRETKLDYIEISKIDKTGITAIYGTKNISIPIKITANRAETKDESMLGIIHKVTLKKNDKDLLQLVGVDCTDKYISYIAIQSSTKNVVTENTKNSIRLCNELGLKKIKYQTPDLTHLEFKSVDDYGSDYYILDSKNNIKLHKGKKIGAGSYGVVYVYETKIEPIYKVAVKETGDTNEFELASKISRNYVNMICGQTPTHPLENPFDINAYYIAMPLYEDNLYNIREPILKLSVSNKLKLIIDIFSQYYCMYTHGYCYTDIKIENVLYKCEHDRLHVSVCDIGSMVKCDDSAADDKTTYDTYFDIYKDKYDRIGNVQLNRSGIMIWGSIIMLLSLLLKNTASYDELTTLFYSLKPNGDKNYFKNFEIEIRNMFIFRDKTYEKICDAYLSFCFSTYDKLFSSEIPYDTWYFSFIDETKYISKAYRL